jgi:hypothetical protein
MTITAQKYTFTCRFETEARLPDYLGKNCLVQRQLAFFPFCRQTEH